MNAAERYHYEIDPDAQSAGAYVLHLVGTDQRVLEIGAGPGSIARPLVERNGCTVTALEVDEDAVRVLRTFCDDVVQADLNSPGWSEHVDSEGYDCVVAADVLEHLIHPKTVLTELAGLAKDRRVVVSLPHVGHNALAACVMQSNFRYGPWGLLDDTHIRFFGLSNIQQMFEDIGLQVCRVEFVRISPRATEFADIWTALPWWKRVPLLPARTGDVYQVVVEAKDSEVADANLNIENECRSRFHADLKSRARQLPSRAVSRLKRQWAKD